MPPEVPRAVLEGSRSLIYRKTHLKCEIMSPSPDPGYPADPPDPPDPGDPVHGLSLGTSPTRAGGQDDVSSKQTPSNHDQDKLERERNKEIAMQ